MDICQGGFEMRRRAKAVLLVAAVLWAVPESGAEQATTGTITGTVTDARGAPVSAAEVNVSGTSLSTLTAADGRYTIANVPAGTVTVVVHRIVYGSGE